MKVDATIARARNSSLILRRVWNERRISRAELSRQTGLSRSTVSDIVSELLASGMVREVGAGTSTGGRRPILVEFHDDSYCIVGVDIGATHIGVTRTNLRGEVTFWESVSSDCREDPDGTLLLLERLVDTAVKASSVPLIGIGVSVPCPVDPKRPDELSTTVLPRWANVRLHSWLSERYEVPVFVDNDANCGVIAEQWWGAGVGHNDITFVKVATGVGAGFILSGQIYRGTSGVAGELGHIVVDPNGSRCVCGLRGCLGTRIGYEALLERTQQLASRVELHPLQRSGLRISDVIDASNQGCELAQGVIGEAGRYLGLTVASLLNLLNPSIIILGGGLTRAGDALVTPMKEALEDLAVIASRGDSEIVISGLGITGIALGASTMVLSEALNHQAMFPVLTQLRSVLQ